MMNNPFTILTALLLAPLAALQLADRSEQCKFGTPS